jgi:hypothetical protein
MSWRNDDGLLVKFGTEKADVTQAGETLTMGGLHKLEFDIDLAVLGADTTDKIVADADTVWLPAGAFIQKVTLIATEVWAGTNANLDLGLSYYNSSGVLTELDHNGLLAAYDTLHGAAVGTIDEVVQGSTEHGALVGSALAATNEKYVVTGAAETAAFTAGQARVQIEYRQTAYPDID